MKMKPPHRAYLSAQAARCLSVLGRSPCWVSLIRRSPARIPTDTARVLRPA